MRARGLLVAGLVAALLALPAVAQAKGPVGADIDGPGLAAPITLRGEGESGNGTEFGALVDDAGFFPAVFEETPSPMLAGRPAGDLGPKYVITWLVPGSSGEDRVTQEAYPFAKAGPFTYMAPGQRVLDGMQTRGGWFPARDSLRRRLVSLGVPAKPSGVPAKPSGTADPAPARQAPAPAPQPAPGPEQAAGVDGAKVAAVLVALVALVGTAALVLLRRRPRVAATR